MADIILSPLVDAVIGNLVSAATDEIKMLWGVKEEVDRLHRTLKALQVVLEDAEEKQVTSNAVKNWLHELKEVAYDVDDIVDEFAAEALRAKLEGSMPETSKRKQVKLWWCSECKSLPPLGQLPSLKELWLSQLKELRILGDEFCGDNGTFPSLEYLRLAWLHGLEEWSGGMEGGGEYMPCLRQLEIETCPKLKQLPEKGLPTSLLRLEIIRCPILKERCKKEIGEDWPKISHIPELEIES